MNELLLTGNVSESEIQELNNQLPNVKVIKYQTKGLPSSDLVQIVFQDLDLITFTRDFILAYALNEVIRQIKYVIKYFKSKRKRVENINLEIQIKDNDNKEFLLYISTDSERLDAAITMIDDKLEMIIDQVKHGKTIQVELAKNSDRLEINEI